MLAFLNGKFVPEEQALVSVFDRSFLYGDGLFETIRVFNAIPFRWRQHFERFEQGNEFLRISMPFGGEDLRRFADRLIAENRISDGVLRLSLSRGVGVRGYSPKGADHPFLVMSLHSKPPIDAQKMVQWRLVTSTVRLPANEKLATFKTCNKLPQIMARAEADALDAQEALLLNTDGYVVEGSSSNLFWIEEDTVCTPPIASGILAGVTRSIVFELCHNVGLATREANLTPAQIANSSGIFMSLSSLGIVEAIILDGLSLHRSPVIALISQAYYKLLRSETSPATHIHEGHKKRR
jgi:aminodeoxychorismate lyase